MGSRYMDTFNGRLLRNGFGKVTEGCGMEEIE